MSTTYPTSNPTSSHISRSTTTTTIPSSCIITNQTASTTTSSSVLCGSYGGGPQITDKPISDPVPSPNATNTHIDKSPNPSSPSKSGAETVGNLAAIISSIGLLVFGIGCLRLRQMRQQQRRIRESSDQLRDHTNLSPSSTSSPPDYFLPPRPLLPPVPPTPSSSLTLSMSMSMQQPSSSLLPPLLSPVPSHLLLYSRPRSAPQQHIEMLTRLQDQYPDSPPPPYEAPPPRSHPRYR